MICYANLMPVLHSLQLASNRRPLNTMLSIAEKSTRNSYGITHDLLRKSFPTHTATNSASRFDGSMSRERLSLL